MLQWLLICTYCFIWSIFLGYFLSVPLWHRTLLAQLATATPSRRLLLLWRPCSVLVGTLLEHRVCVMCTLIWTVQKRRSDLGLKFPYASARNTKTFFRSVKRCSVEGSFVDRKKTHWKRCEGRLNENDYYQENGWFDLHGERSTASLVRIAT